MIPILHIGKLKHEDGKELGLNGFIFMKHVWFSRWDRVGKLAVVTAGTTAIFIQDRRA